MNSMKIIDLLNKIANGEETPKKIKYENDIYILTDNYCYYCDETNLILSDRLYAEQSRLNDEVEILEEENKIPEKLDIRQEKNIKNNWKWKVYGKEHSYNISTPQKIIADKVNEICDYLKSKGDE